MFRFLQRTANRPAILEGELGQTGSFGRATCKLLGFHRAWWCPGRDRCFVFSGSGAAAAEFAIVLPALVLCLFAVISFSSTLYIQNNMVNAAREAVRQMAVVEAPNVSGAVFCAAPEAQAAGSAEYIACAYLTFWGTNFIVDAETGCPLEDKATVRISVDAAQASLMDIFGFFTGKSLTAEVSMRKEDPCA